MENLTFQIIGNRLNHFIEVCLDTEDNVWLMLHSGSRNIGKEIAERHIATAKTLHRLNELPDPNLAYFIQGTKEFQDYWHDLDWAQGYAMMNRQVMMKRLLKSFNRMFNKQKEFRPEIAVNCHHNYVAEETHFGEKVFVTRKGAINAEAVATELFPARWARNRSSSKVWETRKATIPAHTAQVAKCRARRQKNASPAKTSNG